MQQLLAVIFAPLQVGGTVEVSSADTLSGAGAGVGARADFAEELVFLPREQFCRFLGSSGSFAAGLGGAQVARELAVGVPGSHGHELSL